MNDNKNDCINLKIYTTQALIEQVKKSNEAGNDKINPVQIIEIVLTNECKHKIEKNEGVGCLQDVIIEGAKITITNTQPCDVTYKRDTIENIENKSKPE